jgi:flavodoxin
LPQRGIPKGELMKIAVRYQSRGGNTRAVAEVIAECLELKAEPINMQLTENVDLLFFGVCVYKWDADPQLIEYLQGMDANKIGQVVAFSTTGGMKKAITRIAEYAQKAGIKVNENQLCLKMLLQGHSALGREGGHLTDSQIAKVKQFVSEVVRI